MKNGDKKGFWNFVDRLEGDKVVWMIVLLLILISIVAVFSSTPQLALQTHSDRLSIVREQLMVAVLGLGLIVALYSIRKIGIYRFFAQFGYLVSIIMLVILASHQSLGFIKPVMLNHAWRILKIGPVQIHVFEFVKVAMILYLAWAVTAYNKGEFWIANHFRDNEKLGWLAKPIWQRIIYIYIPIFSTAACMMVGSLSSTIFIGGIMFLTILLGGFKLKHVLASGVVAIGFILLLIAFNAPFPADKKPFPHLDTALGRIASKSHEQDPMTIIMTASKSSPEYQDAVDKLQQPMSAEIAIREGKILGKGPGKSTQRYVTPVMFEDYMFSFIVEEYGLIGGIIVIILYLSLLSRGSMIVRGCDNAFAKTTVAGLVLLIALQAMMHMMVNVDIGPMTGQTLPMISHGNSSFLMFSIAFGIILSISRMAKAKMAREDAHAEPLTVHHEETRPDEVKDTLEDLETLESIDSGME